MVEPRWQRRDRRSLEPQPWTSIRAVDYVALRKQVKLIGILPMTLRLRQARRMLGFHCTHPHSAFAQRNRFAFHSMLTTRSSTVLEIRSATLPQRGHRTGTPAPTSSCSGLGRNSLLAIKPLPNVVRENAPAPMRLRSVVVLATRRQCSTRPRGVVRPQPRSAPDRVAKGSRSLDRRAASYRTASEKLGSLFV